MLEFITNNLIFQIQLATIGVPGGFSIFDQFVENISKYKNAMINFPPILLIGDGFSQQFGMNKGGDMGFIESMARLGLPLFITVVFGFSRIFSKTMQRCLPGRKAKKSFENEVLIFNASILLLLLIMEIHYSAWNAKSVLPILFMALGLLKLSNSAQKMNYRKNYLIRNQIG